MKSKKQTHYSNCNSSSVRLTHTYKCKQGCRCGWEGGLITAGQGHLKREKEMCLRSPAIDPRLPTDRDVSGHFHSTRLPGPRGGKFQKSRCNQHRAAAFRGDTYDRRSQAQHQQLDQRLPAVHLKS